MSDPIRIEVFGKPATAGSKRAQAIYRKGPDGKPVPVVKDGRVLVTVRDDNERSGDWKATVAQCAAEQYLGPVLDRPLRLDVTFYLPRPQGHYGTGRNADVLKPSAPLFHTTKPDVLKLTRAIEDALTGVVYRDDSLIHDGRQRKVLIGPGERTRVVIEVTPEQHATVGDKRAHEQLALAA